MTVRSRRFCRRLVYPGLVLLALRAWRALLVTYFSKTQPLDHEKVDGEVYVLIFFFKKKKSMNI